MAEAVPREGSDIRAEDMVVPPELPSDICDFFENSTVFLTGATGFLGNVLLEKLLRTCKSIRKIYILIRLKKEKSPDTRFGELFSEVIFERLWKEQPNFIEKVAIIPGNLRSPGLEIGKENRQKLIQEVDVIFHLGATVRFDEPLRVATDINLKGTKEILTLGKEMRNLRALIHVSTAYAHCPRLIIEETFYEPPVTCDRLLSIVDTLEDDELATVCPVIMKDWPNTYALTKAVAEHYVQKYGKDLPIAIVRPAIVISTAKEPIAGWINNVYGPTGVAVGAAVGLLRTLHCNPEKYADLVPVDYVVNCMIAAAWNIGTSKGHNLNKEITDTDVEGLKIMEEIPIYNYVSSNEKPIKWKTFMQLIEKNAFAIPSPVILWYYCFRLNSSWYIHTISVYLLHMLPGIIADAILILIGKKPVLVKGYKKVQKFTSVMSYFSTQQWKFHNNNVQALWKKLKRGDKNLFEFNMRTHSWDEYFHSYVRGMRVYLMKDPMETIPQGRVKILKLKIAHYTLVSLLLLGFIRLIFTLLSAIFG